MNQSDLLELANFDRYAQDAGLLSQSEDRCNKPKCAWSRREFSRSAKASITDDFGKVAELCRRLTP